MEPKAALDTIILNALQGSATPEEVAELEAWRRESAEHELRFREAAAILQVSRELDHGVRSEPPPAEELIRSAIRARPVPRRSPAVGMVVRYRWRMAVAAAVAAVLLIGFFWASRREPSAPVAFGIEEFRTGSNEMATVRLVDGTIVRLAPESRLRLSEAGREVWLDGQAFFGVARNETAPFVVHTALGEVHVLGTRFDVRARDQDFRTVVVDGHVAVAANGGEVALDAGQMSLVGPGERPSVSAVEDVYALLDWLGQSMIFQDTPLPRVAEEFLEKYDVRVDVIGAELLERTVTAWFTDESFSEAFEVVCDVVGAACSIDGETATMRPRL